MSDCIDVCEVVVDTLMNLGYDIKTEEQDCTDVLDAFCKYNQNYADLLTACEESLVIFKEVLRQYAGHDASGRRLKLPIERMLEIAIAKANNP